MEFKSTPRNSARILALELLKENNPDLTGNLSRVLARLADQDLRQGILDAFRQEQDRLDISQLWAAWNETRHVDLEKLLLEIGLPATTPFNLGVISQLKLGQLEPIKNSGAEIIPALLQAGNDPDPALAENALQVLANLQNLSAREEVCRWVIEHNHPVAREIALRTKYLPKDPQQRALFFLFTEQWKQYESLDFDASLLSTVFQAAGPDLRNKISKFALHSGWSGYVDAITHSRRTRKLSDLNDNEWDTILTLLSRDRRCDEMWRLVQAASVERSAQIMRELADLDWQPENKPEQSDYANWMLEAIKCMRLGKPASRLPVESEMWQAHARPVTCLSMHPQGHLLASGSSDHQVCIWRTEDCSLVQRLQSHSAYIQSLSASSDGVYLASGSADRSVRIWNFENGDLIHSLGGHAGEIVSLAFSSDSHLLASGDSNQVKIWNVDNGKLISQFQISDGPVKQLAFEPGGQFLFAGGQASLSIISLTPKTPRVTIPERVRSWQLLFSHQPGSEENRLITSSSYKKIRLWAIPSGQQLLVFEGLADGENLCAGLDEQFVIASERNILRKWRLSTGNYEYDLEGHNGPITHILYNPHGKFLISAGEEGSIRLWQTYNDRNLLISDLSAAVFNLQMDQAGINLAYSQQNRITRQKLVDLDKLFRQPLESIHPEMLGEIEVLAQSIKDANIELAWINLVRLGVNWHRRYDIEISETIPVIDVGSYDIQLG